MSFIIKNGTNGAHYVENSLEIYLFEWIHFCDLISVLHKLAFRPWRIVGEEVENLSDKLPWIGLEQGN